MKALILVGGFGTRLRPLTLTVPKSVIDFCDKPIMVHQIAALAAVGVKEIVLAINYLPEKIEEYLSEYEQEYNIKITCSRETEPMGTGGPIKLAEEILKQDNEDGMFFVFNSDIIWDYPLQEMIDFHKSHGKEGTLVTSKVDDPSRFGVIISDENGKITEFVEKPQEYVGDDINAGLYLFSSGILDRIGTKPTSIEREIFPQMAADDQLYTLQLEGFWKDIGQPKDFLLGAKLYMQHLESKGDDRLKPQSENILECVMIHPSAEVAEDAIIGPNVSIGAECVIKSGARIKDSCIFPKSTVHEHAFISNSIVSRSSVIGKWSRLEELSLLAENVQVDNEILLVGSKVLPKTTVDKNHYEPGDV